MSALPKKKWTVADYLDFEHSSSERHEFVSGEVFMMTGASENHNLIVSNLIISLGAQLRGRPCKVYPSDMLLEIEGRGDYHYPDVTVVCEPAVIKHEKQDILTNPTLVIEVLSPSTEAYDRGRKLHNYLSVVSIQDYLLVSQEMSRVERYQRQENNQWLYSEMTASDAVINLTAIGCTLPLIDVYVKVTFDET